MFDDSFKRHTKRGQLNRRYLIDDVIVDAPVGMHEPISHSYNGTPRDARFGSEHILRNLVERFPDPDQTVIDRESDLGDLTEDIAIQTQNPAFSLVRKRLSILQSLNG